MDVYALDHNTGEYLWRVGDPKSIGKIDKVTLESLGYYTVYQMIKLQSVRVIYINLGHQPKQLWGDSLNEYYDIVINHKLGKLISKLD